MLTPHCNTAAFTILAMSSREKLTADSIDDLFSLKTKLAVGACSAAAVLGLAIASRYRVCKSNQYLVRTGLGISDINVVKHGFDLKPIQRCQFVDVNAKTYKYELHNMSQEKVEFLLPVSFTVCPADPVKDSELFKNYSRRMLNTSETDFDAVVQGIIHGQTRGLCASMTIEEMFNGKDKFKQMATDHIQSELSHVGVQVLNANIADMKDLPGTDNLYFQYRKQKAVQKANNEAKIEVAEANRTGEIGKSQREADAAQQIAKYHAETMRVKNAQDLLIAESVKTLEVSKADFKKQQSIAQIEADQYAEMKKVELARHVEELNQQRNLEKQRADTLTITKVNAECAIQQAEGESLAKRNIADADAYKTTKLAEANTTAQKFAADAALYTKEKEAEGLQRLYNAKAVGLQQILDSANGNADLVKFAMAIETGLFQNVADASAKAINGLSPKVNIWQTGADGNDSFRSLATNLTKTIPPLMDVLSTQTGIDMAKFIKTDMSSKDIMRTQTESNMVKFAKNEMPTASIVTL